MSKFADIRKGINTVEALERELHLKQLQINRLLNITQAINNNVSAGDLYKMYASFLSWEMGVKKMALFISLDNSWKCTTYIGLKEELTKMDITDRLQKFERLKNLEEEDHPLIKEFDVVIPVMHKKHPIAYAFIGGFNENDDMYNKVQFITTITNIIAVAIENKRLFKRQLEQERLKREMELASEMQKMLVPTELPKSNCYEMASIYKPHLGVGGDYFDYVELKDRKIAFCVADISGKGVAAALLMANFQANFHSLIHKEYPLEEFIKELNTSVLKTTNGERFLTFFGAIYNRQTKELQYINAGHNPPVMVMDGELSYLDKGCTILGSFEELPEIEVGKVDISKEALILSYTDGLSDIQNELGDYYDDGTLVDFVRKYHSLNPNDFNQLLLDKINLFKGTLNYPDDFTVLTCKLFPN